MVGGQERGALLCSDGPARPDRADVVVVGAGPAGLYAGLVLRRGIPTDAPNGFRVLVLERAAAGGLARFGHITFSKRWAFSGSLVVKALREEAESIDVEIRRDSRVIAVTPSAASVTVETLRGPVQAKYVILATGIVPAPEAITDRKVLIGLGNEDRLRWDVSRKAWKRVVLYGNDQASLEGLADVLGPSLTSTTVCCATDAHLREDVRLAMDRGAEAPDFVDRLPGLPMDLVEAHDGVIIDYNSYKAWNGSTGAIAMPDIATDHGYIRTSPLGRTTSRRVYAAGNVCTPASGVLPAMSSALTAALAVGRELEQAAGDAGDRRDRFPWFPRRASWEDSWLVELEREAVSEAEVLR